MNPDYYTVYILYSLKSGIYYTGFTSDLIKRFHDHNLFNVSGFTVKHRPWMVFYTEILPTKSKAMQREKFLKSGRGRTFIKNDIYPVYSLLI